MEQERLELLLNRYFDQALTADEKYELEQSLLVSTEARETFWERSRWHGALRQWSEEGLGRVETAEAVVQIFPASQLRATPSPKRAPAPVRGRAKPTQRPAAPSNWWRPLAAAAILMLGFMAWTRWHSTKPGTPVQSEEIAHLMHTSNAVWADTSATFKDGEKLNGGTIKLKSGALQIDFTKGARVVLEGPAEFELLTNNSGALKYGKLIATVPESAHGFSVKTPDFSVVDHGTQFGCMVPMSAAPEVHVFQGAIGVETASKEQRELLVNQAVRLTGSQMEDIPANPSAFITEEKLARLDAWREFSRTFSQHPGMLLHYDFENDSNDGSLTNHAPNAISETNGIIEGCEWAEGRWQGKGALKFDSGEDRVRLSLPGEYPTLTFIAFLRTKSTLYRDNSLIQTLAEEKLGETSWSISNDGALGWRTRIAPRGSASQWLRVFSEPVFREEKLNSWHMVATVYDGTSVTHYLDGKKIGSTPVQLPSPVHFGDIQIGNGLLLWEPRTLSETAVNFIGSIDQLSILSMPLTAEELQKIYEQSR